jgi:hypothetical protein
MESAWVLTSAIRVDGRRTAPMVVNPDDRQEFALALLKPQQCPRSTTNVGS